MAKPADKATALWVIKRLRSEGFQGVLAGGCVRDMLLGIRSSDYDVATDATPQEVKKLFRHVLLIGAKFGVAMVVHKGRRVEVATFRSDVSYSDGRRPDAVRFSDLRQDALRRDFTINGMFFDLFAGKRGKVVDYVGGREDLRRKILRTIGNPDRRFAEDYLRMIRAVRFAVRFGFRMDPKTVAAVRRHASKITSISGERIYDELAKMLAHRSAAQAAKTLADLGLARYIFPQLFDGRASYEAGVARLTILPERRDCSLALGGLVCELPAADIRKLVRKWGASNELKEELCFYAKHLDRWVDAESMPLCDFKRLMASPHFDGLRQLWLAEEKLQTGLQLHSRRIARRAKAIPRSKVAPSPLLTGDDLIKMGLPEGPRLGRVLRRIYDAQLNDQISTRRQAVRLAKSLIGGH